VSLSAVPVKAESETLDPTMHTPDPPLWVGCALATAAVLILLWALGRAEERPSARELPLGMKAAREAWTVPLSRCLNAVLLVGLLAAALMLPWTKLQAVGADVLGYLGFDGFAGDTLRSDREVAKPVLAALASVTLLLWAFQALWAR